MTVGVCVAERGIERAQSATIRVWISGRHQQAVVAEHLLLVARLNVEHLQIARLERLWLWSVWVLQDALWLLWCQLLVVVH